MMKVYAIETISIHSGASDIGYTFYRDKNFAEKFAENLKEADAKSQFPLFKEVRVVECNVE